MMEWIARSLDRFMPPAASSYALDIDFVFNLVFWIVIAFWFVLVQAIFIGLIVRFRKRDGVGAQYITGELKHEHRFIAWPHYVIMICDVILVAAAIRVEVQRQPIEAEVGVGVVARAEC